jgi:hypothetical protein
MSIGVSGQMAWNPMTIAERIRLITQMACHRILIFLLNSKLHFGVSVQRSSPLITKLRPGVMPWNAQIRDVARVYRFRQNEFAERQRGEIYPDVSTTAEIATPEGLPPNPLKLNAALICQQTEIVC